MNNSQKVGKVAMFLLYFFALFLVSSKLFFDEQFNKAVSSLKFWGKEGVNSLTVGFAEPAVSLNPLANDTGSRSRLFHLYEPLVRVTPDLQIEPALAVSYGSLDDSTWEFRLRPDVFFHNGAQLKIDDVIFSINEAKFNSKSGVRDLASTIKEIQKVGEDTIRIITNSTDPLLLQKISAILIFPKQNEDGSAIGTGPYKLEKNDNDILTLKRFDKYWGDAPKFETAVLKTFTTKDQKLAALKNHEVDILADMPADLASNFDFSGFNLRTLPSLEVNFLMFGFDGVFKDKSLREAVVLALKTDQLAKLAQGFAVTADQFVGNGIFGYDPSIKKIEPDADAAEKLVMAAGNNKKISVTLDLPKGLEFFGQTVKDQLSKIGMNVTLNFLSSVELGKKITNRSTEFFFFGWRSDLGDASDFLTAVAHSSNGYFGQFNGGNYSNPDVDKLIEQARSTLKQDERLKMLREAMKKITVEDIIGVPLFSPEVLYGVSDGIKWSPRVDGYVLAQEVKI